ncbi:MAG: bifunctional DNA primase/polymerase [Anaerolineales bacterium]|nr:bifunctional DNA primase/polymerase [Anaerolineales bacterium]
MNTIHLTPEQLEVICEPAIGRSRYRAIRGTKLLVNTKENNRVVSENYNGLNVDEYQLIQGMIAPAQPTEPTVAPAEKTYTPRNDREATALDMLSHGITPVRLGSSGEWLKIPLDKGWETATITAQDVRQWFDANANTNVGARGGQNFLHPDLYLARLDFDAGAEKIYPKWQTAITDLPAPAVSKTRQGYHAWIYTDFPLPNKTVAGRWIKNEQGKRALQKFIELKAAGGQVVAPGCLHPSGFTYHWVTGSYKTIPLLTEPQARALLEAAQQFDLGGGAKDIRFPSDPEQKPPQKPAYKKVAYGAADDLREIIRERFDLLSYATNHMVYDEIQKQRRRTKIGGNGGFFVYDDHHWWCFADNCGGDCYDLVGYLEYGSAWFSDKSGRFLDVLKLAAVYVNVTIPEDHPIVTGEEDASDTINIAYPKTRDYWKAFKKTGFEFRVNQLLMRVECNGEPMNEFTEARVINRCMDLGLKNVDRIKRAWLDLAYHEKYHPVRNYFEALPPWDHSTDHIGDFVKTYLQEGHGIADWAFRRWMVGSVARAFEATQNIVMVWAGKQKLGKSTLARWLAPIKDLHIEKTMELNHWKDNEIRVASYFTWEWPEAQQVFSNERLIQPMKDLLTRETVVVRMHWDKYDTPHYNLANHIATLNYDGVGFYSDTTGNRRYLTLDIQAIDHSYLTTVDVNRLWAQAYALYLNGFSYKLTEEEEAIQSEINKLYQKEAVIETYFYQALEIVDIPGPLDWLNLTEALEALHLAGLQRTNQQENADNLRRILNSHGFTNHNARLRLPYTARRPKGYQGLRCKDLSYHAIVRAREARELADYEANGVIADA